jgi:cytochrome b subunit of formate dehydrogenase/mono/diheme cytochrome c family protein
MSDPTPVDHNDPAPTITVKTVTRFSLLQRLEHLVLLLSFTMLALTGLPQKFATVPLSQFVIDLFGGIESIRVVHHIAAIVLMILSIYHVVVVVYRVFVRRVSWTMLPTLDDFKHLWQDLLFYFGRRKHKAYYGRYNYAEKAEYLAVVWGILIMIVTGFMMWNPIATTNLLPGEAIPAAKVAHGGEALLAVLAIILWHFYHVHLRHFNKSMFTGKFSRDEMQHEHPAELALIEAGNAHSDPDPKTLRRRQTIFYPIAAVIVIVSGFGLINFITFEKTAIDTVPPAITGVAFVPFTPTPTLTLAPTPTPTETPIPTDTPTPSPFTPTPAAVVADAWDTTISQLFDAKCAACHIQAQMNDLSLKTYADALKGGKSGPAIVPNDPDKSMLVKIQSAGGHPGQLSSEELAQVVAWIKAGAIEKAAAPPAAVEGWVGGIDQIINAKCAACHIQAQMNDLSLKTYADALKGGKSGPAIVPNDPDKSVLIQVQQKGGHPGQLSDDELKRIIAWINAGAPEQGGTPPTPPPASNVEGWVGGIDQIINAKCAACHVQAQMNDLSLKTYADALKGGKSGAAIVPNDPDKSVLVQVQQKGGHPGQLSDDELKRIIAWIKAGAPEQGGASTPPPASGGESWAGSIDQLVTSKCAACHVQAQSGGLSLKTYADALQGGKDGPAIVPNDPDKSMLVQVQQKGGHPGQFSSDELARIIAWIKAGAPEQGGTPPPVATESSTPTPAPTLPTPTPTPREDG